MIYRARTLVTMAGPPLADGALVVGGDRVAAAGAWPDVRRLFPTDAVTDLGDQIILPGLINAHCHLDYSTMRGSISKQASFAAWIQRINALKRGMDSEDYLAAIALGFREVVRHGTTTVFNIEAFPELMLKMPPPPVRTWWFYELMDLRGRDATEDLVTGALAFFESRPDWLGGFGLSPHAPYTASEPLYWLARNCALLTGMPITTHMAESREEFLMFGEGSGPLYQFLAKLGRPMNDCGGGESALERLTAAGALGPECLLVHMNELSEADLALLAPGGLLHGGSVVHCPLSHHYFQHSPFPLARLREAGANLCLGTDSLASNGSLDLLAEARELARAAKSAGVPLSPRELLETITCNPARAIGLGDRLGSLKPGAWADFIAIPAEEGGAADAYETILRNRRPITCVHVAGRAI